MRLTFVISSLSAGGAERVMAIMANYWANKGWKISLLTFDDGRVPPFYKLDPLIRYQTLDIASPSPNPIVAIKNNIKSIVALRAAIRESQPDWVISFIDQTNVLTLLATRGLGIAVAVEEHIHVQSHNIGRFWELLRRLTYPQADLLVAITERALSGLPSTLRHRSVAIPNPVVRLNRCDTRLVKQLLTRPSLVAMGRLAPQKGFDLLLKAFALQKERHPMWNLSIIGEGPLREELNSLSNQLGLENRVKFIGQVTNPEDYLNQADLFVMASRFEGFPMALCEAMACGLPVIHTDCLTGPREIIRDGIDGVLVPNEDIDSLAAAMCRLMSDEGERHRLASRAREITERFSVTSVMGRWEELLRQTMKQRAS